MWNSNKGFSSKTGCNRVFLKIIPFYLTFPTGHVFSSGVPEWVFGVECFGFAFWVSLEAELSKVKNMCCANNQKIHGAGHWKLGFITHKALSLILPVDQTMGILFLYF